MNISLPKPNPDVNEVVNIIKGQYSARVHFLEINIDAYVLKKIATEILGMDWIDPSGANTQRQQETALRNYAEVYYRLGYDCFRLNSSVRFGATLNFPGKKTAKENGKFDTAAVVSPSIADWNDFKTYAWPDPEKLDVWPLEFTSSNLPRGMGILVSFCYGIFELLMNNIFGLDNLAIFIYEKPELVKAVINRAGETIFRAYERVVGIDNVVGFFQSEDMGYKSSMLVSPQFLSEHILPWHKKFADLAHKNRKLYILHSCGYIEPVMELLINDVGIDAKHSFEDQIQPVAAFKEQYGHQVAAIGGVDVDKLCQFSESELRRYVRSILAACTQKGRYLLGTGNSVADYVPVSQFLAMLDEGVKWST